MRTEKQTAQEVELPGGEETEENLPLFPTPSDDEVQAVLHGEMLDWDNDPAVILHDQAAVAAYYNSMGELVVKQRDTLGCEATLFIANENISRFVARLRDRAKRGDDE